ncbi:MAG: PaaI family thioesterase [Deltaproteobacteria bacterium]|nr:PaaI family thioesterase [Deltaproteobacteria bacterium]
MDGIRFFQDFYPDALAQCYGCGRLNEHGLHVRSRWEGNESVCIFEPRPYHTAVPGFVYGGLIASLVDCHSTGTASAAAFRAEGRELGTDPPRRFVTASLHVDYLKPTPMGVPLLLRSTVEEVRPRKVVVVTTVLAGTVEVARGRVVAVLMPDSFLPAAP